MRFSRRTLLKAGAVCAAGSVLPISLEAAEISRSLPRNLRDFSFETFRLRSGETFTVAHQGRKSALELIEVRNLLANDRPNTNRGECFSLLFRGSPEISLTQGTVSLHHPQLGSFAMFLARVNQPRPDGAYHYEAIVNRSEESMSSSTSRASGVGQTPLRT
jgi:hypothetical protein